MYGVIEVDWIDEFKDDIILIDCIMLNWEYFGFELFFNWGVIEIRKFINQFLVYRKLNVL